jgi:hypothetical protein
MTWTASSWTTDVVCQCGERDAGELAVELRPAGDTVEVLYLRLGRQVAELVEARVQWLLDCAPRLDVPRLRVARGRPALRQHRETTGLPLSRRETVVAELSVEVRDVPRHT